MVGPPYMTTNFYADVYFRKTPWSEEVHNIQFLYIIAGLHPRANKTSSYAGFYRGDNRWGRAQPRRDLALPEKGT